MLQREATGANPGIAPPIVHKVLASPGQPLPASERAFFEPRFGHDFSQVRIHADHHAAESALAVRARAYTVGSDLVFGADEYQSNTSTGKRLLAHELVHVVQSTQSRNDGRQTNGLSVSQPTDTAEQEAEKIADAVSQADKATMPINETTRGLSRSPLDVNAIDQNISIAARASNSLNGIVGQSGLSGAFLNIISQAPQLAGHLTGEIAFAANYPGAITPAKQPASPVPKADKTPVPIDTSVPIEAHYFPSGRPGSTERALILGGFHGDEHPGRQIAEELINELSTPSPSRPLFFHTIVVPRVNAGGIADELAGTKFWRNRCNRQAVDLNRNFPTGGTPRDTDCVNTVGAPTQPEVQGVIDLIRAFKPDRILSTHAISTPSEAGIFADPNTDPAAITLARGMASTVVDPSNRPFNRLTTSAFNPIYPKDTPGRVSGGTSLGAFGPTATGGNIPVITIEAPEFKALASTGTRTTEAFLRPMRAFLTDPGRLETKADEDILTDIDAFSAVDRIAFLTGRLPLANEIYKRIQFRIETALANLNALSPPQKVTIVSGLRLFADKGPTGGQSQAEIVYNKFFLRNSPDTESFPGAYFIGGVRKNGVDRRKWLNETSATRLAIILKFSALPGASRHHWATDVDFNSTSSQKWAPATAGGTPGSLFSLGVWLQANAAKVGFIQSYTPGRKSGYNEEPWHYSYAPLAIGLRQRYNTQVKLPTDVATAFLTDLKARAKKDGQKVPADLDAAVAALKISDFVDDIGPGL